MGKTYIDTVKYLVYANVEIGGLVEKPDVVGAVFGQTEGLLGDDLDLRELQKNGRIGRIEVDIVPRGGKSVGKIKLPSSLDMVETCILAAALETVDRVGPCEARLAIDKIEDTRSTKRKVLVDRAKSLLKNMLLHEIPESKEISEQVRSEVKTSEVADYGPEKLPAGPGIGEADSIILVEGRADVINLLKNDITNVVAVGGANVSPAIAKLCLEKEVTVFLDGDRGGDIIMAELARICDIDFVARAPTGKEVEELTRKEIIKCLRSKIAFEQGSTGPGEDERRARYRPQASQARSVYGREGIPNQGIQGQGMQGQNQSIVQNPNMQNEQYGRQNEQSYGAPASRQNEQSFGGNPQPSAPLYGSPASSYSTRSGDVVSGRSGRSSQSFRGRERGRNEQQTGAQSAPLSAPPQMGIRIESAPPIESLVSAVKEGIPNLPAAESSASAQPASGPATGAQATGFESSGNAQLSAPEPLAAPALTSVPGPLLTALDEMEGTLKARFYSPDFSMLKELPVRDMIRSLESEPAVFAVVFDGIITQRLADLAETKKASVLLGAKLGNVFRKPTTVLLHTKN